MSPSSMKPSPVSVRTHRGTSDRTPSLPETLSFDKPYLGKKRESKQKPSSEKVGLSKSSQLNAQKPQLKNEDDSELVKYMSNLPCFLQQKKEKESSVQDKALNFGVLDWKLLEKWKHTERMPGNHPSQKTQSSSNVCNPTSGNVAESLRFGSPKRRKNGEEYHKEDKNAKLLKSNKGKETRDRGNQAAESVRTVRLKDHFHRNVMRKDQKKMLIDTEASRNSIGLESSSQSIESRMMLDELAEFKGQKLSDFLPPQEPNSDGLSTDNKRVEIGENTMAPKERTPSSHMRRLSFDLGKMGRSVSFKDNSTVPQLNPRYSSAKSGPVPQLNPRYSSASILGKFKKFDRANTSGRAMSTPLKRLLDPLLKHRGAHAAETVSSSSTKNSETPSSSGTKSSETAFSSGNKCSSQDRHPEVPTQRALLQLSLKNGLPFLKIVVNNSNEMLAAAVKVLPVPGKMEPCMTYAIYSVHEVKKKSKGWINQGLKSKGKGCGLGYNIVGQMKISPSIEYESTECVLYGVDPDQLDKQTLDYIPNREIAAVIVPNKKREFSHCVSGENRKSSGIVVILPGALHGVPNKGEPSSLVFRWRFGGMCDCGGWDVGCKLRVLSCGESSANDHVALYLEGEGKGQSPVFSLERLSSEYCSIEFDASISLMEAFATCVAYVTSSEFLEITDVKSPLEEEHLSEEFNKRKMSVSFQEQLPAYVTCPPLSPAGRI